MKNAKSHNLVKDCPNKNFQIVKKPKAVDDTIGSA